MAFLMAAVPRTASPQIPWEMLAVSIFLHAIGIYILCPVSYETVTGAGAYSETRGLTVNLLLDVFTPSKHRPPSRLASLRGNADSVFQLKDDKQSPEKSIQLGSKNEQAPRLLSSLDEETFALGDFTTIDSLEIELEIDRFGKISGITVLAPGATPEIYLNYVRARLQEAVFSPAIRENEAVASKIRLAISFTDPASSSKTRDEN